MREFESRHAAKKKDRPFEKIVMHLPHPFTFVYVFPPEFKTKKNTIPTHGKESFTSDAVPFIPPSSLSRKRFF